MNLVLSAKKVAENLRNYAVALADSDMEAALTVAECYGQYCKLNHIGIYADIELEKYFAKRLSYLSNSLVKQAKFETLHLMTTPLVDGGHTRVVERLLVGGLGDGLAVLDKLPERVLSVIPRTSIKHDCLRQYSGTATIKKIIEIAIQYNCVILHIHQDDIYCAVSAVLLAKMGVRVFFYNHSDYCFSFGYSAAEKIFEIGKFGWEKGALRGVQYKQSFVGIPIPIVNVREKVAGYRKPIRGLLAGSAWKFWPWGIYSVPEFLNKLFQRSEKFTGVTLYICGPTGHEKFWRKLSQEARGHVVFFGALPQADYRKILSSVDFYLDSFPIPNGTGFVEPVMLGIPSFGLNIISGYSYADVLKSDSTSDLISELQSFIYNRDDFYRKTLDVREQVINQQSVAACVERIVTVMNGNPNIPIPSGFNCMRYDSDFFEKNWESKKRIYIDLRMLAKISLVQKLGLVKLWRDEWPYHSTLSIGKFILLELKKNLLTLISAKKVVKS